MDKFLNFDLQIAIFKALDAERKRQGKSVEAFCAECDLTPKQWYRYKSAESKITVDFLSLIINHCYSANPNFHKFEIWYFLVIK